MILKPSEKSIHSREDLAPVPESFWSHRYIFYPRILEGNTCRTPLGASSESGQNRYLPCEGAKLGAGGKGKLKEPRLCQRRLHSEEVSTVKARSQQSLVC